MVKSLSLLAKGSKATQRIVSGFLLFFFSFLLGFFPGLYVAIIQPFWGTLNQKPTLSLIGQRVSKEDVIYRFNPEERKGRFLFLSTIIKGKKKGFRKLVLDKEKFKIEISSLLICKSLWLGFTVQTGASYQIMYLTLPLKARDPPRIL